MKFFIISLLTFLLIFTACNEKVVYSDAVSSSSIGEGYGGDIAPPIAMPSPAMRTSDEAMGVSTSTVYESKEPSIMPVPPVEPVIIPIPPEPREVQSGILTVANIDDNLNLTHFQKYVNRALQATSESSFPFMSTKDRVKLTIEGTNEKGMNRVKVKVGDFTGYTNSQGVLYIFPTVDNIPTQTTIELNGKSQNIDLSSKKEFTIAFNKTSMLPKSLDLMFVIDTTGSMGDEMRYLAKEFDAIISDVEAKHPSVDIRFGLTLYRDKGDDYVVKNFKFTSNKNKMKSQLEEQSANGGGDYPEAMDKGIEKALEASWRAEDGVRMMFVVADAPPHDEKIKQMVPIIEKARAMGIHIYPLGASGVAEKAEYIMRHLALFTQGRYLWLTDDSGVGNSHEEPKVSCYQVTRLDQLISRVIQSELSGKRVEANKDSVIRSVGQYNNGNCQ